MTSVAAPLLPGETLGDKYRIERVLGQGGMGVVVAARHLALDERVAIKFLVGTPSEQAVDRFLREARAAAKVKGEHVCRVFDFGRLETGEPYIVMEYLEGLDLSRKVKDEGAQPAARVVGWIVEACAALAEAHELGIVHRDLKPANVFLARRPDGSTCAKVLDFGISKLPQAETITSPTAMMGSPVYMSPEQIESARDVDVRSDIWSLGVVMYELLTGQPPFRADSMVELAVKIREKDPPPIGRPIDEVPAGLRRAIAKCLAKDASDRYATVGELVADLAPFAPPDVSSLVARLTKRTEAREEKDELAFDVTKTADEAGSPLRGTFSPLQSTLGGPPKTQRPSRRWPLVAAVAAGASVVAVFALRSPAPTVTVTPEAASPAPETTTAAIAPVDSSTAPPPPPQEAEDAGAIARPTAAPAPRPPPPPPPKTPPSASASPPIEEPPAKPPPPEPRKRRELDRDDP